MKRSVIVMVAVSVFVVGFSGNGAVAAEKYPVKPVVCIVPNEAGGDADTLARPLMQRVSKVLGQPIVIVNKPGAASSLGYREHLAAKPDGYTIGTATATIITNKLQGIMPYDYNDYTILCTYATYVPFIFASTKTKRPFKAIEELLSFAKANPEEVSVACGSKGLSWWQATMAFQQACGIKFNVLPQPGGGGISVVQAAGGHADIAVIALGAGRSQLEAGNVKALALFARDRFPGRYNYVPTLKEAGCNVTWYSTQVVMAPRNVPKDIAERLVKAFEVAANDPDYLKVIADLYALPFYLPPQKALNFLDEQRVIIRGIMEKSGTLKEK
jgi:tripartite-type tricarboxylate transporter receptor subunit TctC